MTIEVCAGVLYISEMEINYSINASAVCIIDTYISIVD